MRYLLIVILALIVGCQDSNSRNFTSRSSVEGVADNVLKQNPDTDLFVFEERIYLKQDSTHNSSINNGENIGKIKINYSPGSKFESLTATKLPINTKIYKLKNENSLDRLIVDLDGQLIVYQVYQASAEG